MNRVFNNPEIPIEPLVSPSDFASSLEIIVQARLRRAEELGFRAGAHFRECNLDMAVEEGLKLWNNDKPEYRIV